MNTSSINSAVESVIGMINEHSLFANVTRGALPAHEGIVCEIGPTIPDSMHMDKNVIIPLDLTFNGKHPDLKVLSDAMYAIHSILTFSKSYPYGDRWQIVDIENGTLPQMIGREDNNDWLMASSVSVKIYWKGDDINA